MGLAMFTKQTCQTGHSGFYKSHLFFKLALFIEYNNKLLCLIILSVSHKYGKRLLVQNLVKTVLVLDDILFISFNNE